MNSSGENPGGAYAAAGVNTAAADRATELMVKEVSRTFGPQVVGGLGDFAGTFDASELKDFQQPLLVTSTDGVGTKVVIAQALDYHDTIGQDLVGMVIGDIAVTGAKPLFMTDYIACGELEPKRIARIVAGIAKAAAACGCALIGGETAEHPGLMKPGEYDLAGAVTGVVEARRRLGPHRVRGGDLILGVASSGLHANGFSLVRKIIADRKISYSSPWPELSPTGGASISFGEALLTPTRLYVPLLRRLLESQPEAEVHAAAHITGGGISPNLARVLPPSCEATLLRGSWPVPPVFQSLCELLGSPVEAVEDTWNLGLGLLLVVAPESAAASLRIIGEFFPESPSTALAEVITWPAPATPGAEVSAPAKGARGGSVRLVGSW